jgi:hypothetical protein
VQASGNQDFKVIYAISGAEQGVRRGEKIAVTALSGQPAAET